MMHVPSFAFDVLFLNPLKTARFRAIYSKTRKYLHTRR